MQKKYGIASTYHGTFFFATVVKTKKGWKIKRLREWSNQSFLDNYLLLHKPISLSLPAFWTKQLPDVTAEMISVDYGNDRSIHTNQAEYTLYSTVLRHNIIGIYPHDSFLSTLPYFFTSNPPTSYIVLYYDNPVTKIGITIDNALVAVYSSVITTTAELSGYLGRIERYWNLQNSTHPFPGQQFCINKFPFDLPGSPTIKHVDSGTEHPDALRAAGCALCGQTASVPRFDIQTVSKKPGYLRTLLLTMCCITLFLFLGTFAGLLLYSKYFTVKLHTVKNQYHNIINNNVEIRKLVAEGNLLSQKVLVQNNRLSHPTTWGKFLHFLGKTRIKGLYFERIGTEPLKEDSLKTRIAIAGWCTSETLATEFIKTLSKSPLLQNVTLSSIERVPNQESLCKFKIVCILSLSEK